MVTTLYLVNPGIGDASYLRRHEALLSGLAKLDSHSHKLESRHPPNAICGGYLYKLEIYNQKDEIMQLLESLDMEHVDQYKEHFDSASASDSEDADDASPTIIFLDHRKNPRQPV